MSEREAADAAPMAERAAAMRAAFDAAFAEPPPGVPPPGVRLVALRAGGRDLAVRLDELAGVHACPPLRPLPGAGPGLLGLVALHGRVLAVHDLATSLGDPPDEAGWLLVPAGTAELAFACAAVTGAPAADPAQIFAARPHDHWEPPDAPSRPILDLPALVAALQPPGDRP